MIKNSCKFILLIVATVFFYACTQERLPCAQPTIMSVVMGCHKWIGVDTLGNPIFKDTILNHPTVTARDSAGQLRTSIYPQGSNSLIVHMSPISDSCQWIISADTTQVSLDSADVITFYYQSQLNFLSNACGYAYFYTLQKVVTTHHTFDSVQIANTTVNTNVNTEHVKIFMH